MKSIDYSADFIGRNSEIGALFETTFAASEGADEGALIGNLARQLIETTPANDLFVFSACTESQTIGCIIFTRLRFEADRRTVFLLSPVAILPDHQGTGVGSGLLNYGLDKLRQFGADVAVTYGDPDYYRRVGFEPVDISIIPPPLILNQPHGWLAQSLTGETLHPFRGPSQCAQALNDPAYW